MTLDIIDPNVKAIQKYSEGNRNKMESTFVALFDRLRRFLRARSDAIVDIL